MTETIMEHVTPQVATLLVVEDDLDIQSSLQTIFQMEGYTVLAVASGSTAIEMVQKESIDLILLDVMLPDMNGYEVCKHIRQSNAAHTPIVMLTALSQQHNITQGLSIGADDYVKKPFVPEELILRVRNLIDRQEELRSAVLETTHMRDMLELAQRQLEGSKHETTIETTLRREFLHNVTTHIRALAGIAEATVRKVAAGPTRDAVQQLRSRIQGAALVYEVSEALQDDPVEIGSVIQTIASALKSMYRPWKRVLLEVTGTSVELPLPIATPISMIVNELVTNCFKHAFPDNRFGKITVHYTVTDDTFTLDVVDDGVGLNEGQLPSGKGSTTVTYFAQQLGGNIAWSRAVQGTSVQLIIPLR